MIAIDATNGLKAGERIKPAGKSEYVFKDGLTINPGTSAELFREHEAL